jgi:hypothetical protein
MVQANVFRSVVFTPRDAAVSSFARIARSP